MNFDYVVVGGGISGGFLAARLLKLQKKVLWFDDYHEKSASRYAGGLFNLITGKYAKKTWLAEEMYASLLSFYKNSPKIQSCFYFRDIFFPFKTEFEKREWGEKQFDPNYKKWIKVDEKPKINPGICCPLGALRIKNLGRLDIQAFLETVKQQISYSENHLLLNHRLKYNEIDAENQKINTNGETYSFQNLIFAEGLAANNNPFFDVDILPLKGHVLKLRIPDFTDDFILKNRIFLLPTTESKVFLCGTTYEREFETEEPEQVKIKEMFEKIRKATSLKVELIEAYAGLRPTTYDRRPIVGKSELHENIFILNGLGSKGVLLSSFFSEQLIQHIENQIELNRECNPKRFAIRRKKLTEQKSNL